MSLEESCLMKKPFINSHDTVSSLNIKQMQGPYSHLTYRIGKYGPFPMMMGCSTRPCQNNKQECLPKDLLDFLEPEVPTVEAWREATSWCTDSLELMEPEPIGFLRLLALFTIVATVRQ